jgi:hypothetical protein
VRMGWRAQPSRERRKVQGRDSGLNLSALASDYFTTQAPQCCDVRDATRLYRARWTVEADGQAPARMPGVGQFEAVGAAKSGREGAVEILVRTEVTMLLRFALIFGLLLVLSTNVFAQTQNQGEEPSKVAVQSYGRHNMGCMVWTDGCVNCVRQKSGGDFSCSNIGIACQPKEIECTSRIPEPAK